MNAAKFFLLLIVCLGITLLIIDDSIYQNGRLRHRVHNPKNRLARDILLGLFVGLIVLLISFLGS